MHHTGLTTEQAETSRRAHGSNALTAQHTWSFWRHFLANFGDPIIRILLITLAVNVLLVFRRNDWYESVGIALAVLIATLVSTLSERGSEAAFAQIQEEARRTTCRVRRDGRLISLPIEQLVVGDLVYLQAGEGVPADGILVSGEVRVNQSALNGESAEARRTAGGHGDSASLLRGMAVCGGEGMMTVERVGDATLYGNMAREMQVEPQDSPLKIRLSHLAKQLSVIGYIAAVLVGVADIFHALVMEQGYAPAAIAAVCRDIPALLGILTHAATLAITVVVVAVPEGLPMMITVVLSSNMRRMLKDRVLVRRPVGVETSGSINILFTDKTGTLTGGMPTVCRVVNGNGTYVSEREVLRRTHPQWWSHIVRGCCDNNESARSGGRLLGGNATDRALLTFGGRNGGERTAHIPFDSTRKWAACRVSHANGWLIKGAPDCLLSHCTHYIDQSGRTRPLVTAEPLRRAIRELSARAMRVLLLAESTESLTADGALPSLTLVALVGMRDDLRPETADAVAQLRGAGIQTVMVTGDGRDTAVAIATEAGICQADSSADSILTHEELAALTDDQLAARLPRLRVVSRAVPTDKSRLVRVAQQCHLVAGMTGDGVNDAPALKAADVGFAMGSGTEVAKEAGDVVILNDNIASIVKAVLYGRTIFHSIRKFLVFQLTMNVCAVGVSVIGPFIGIDTPVTVMQMLWINLIMDTLAGLAFAGEPPLLAYLKEPPKSHDEPILTGAMLSQIGGMGAYTLGLCVTFVCHPAMQHLFGYQTKPVSLLTGLFALFIFCGIFNSFNARTNRINVTAHLRRNRGFVGIMAAVSAIQVLLVIYGGTLFRTAPLTADQWGRIVLLAASVLPADMLRKWVFKKRAENE